ncbi:MAG: hypothetical protein ACRD21_27805, partial [Vicinamibacteria bacterium]
MPERTTRLRRPWWSLLPPMLLAVLLGGYGLEVSEPHTDVTTVLDVFPPSWGELALDFLTPEGIFGGTYPPLYFFIAKAYGSIAGTDLVTLRMLSVIVLAGLVAVSWYGFAILTPSPSPWLRLWFTLAVASSPAHLWWAQTAKYTMFLYLAYAVAALAALHFLERRSAGSAAFLAFSFFAVFLTHFVSFFFIAATALTLVFIAVRMGDRNLLRTLIRYSAVAAVVTLPFLPAVVQSLIWQRGGYHAAYDEVMSPSNLMRAAIMEWNFGSSLLPSGGGLHRLGETWRLALEGDVIRALEPFAYISPAILAAALLAVSLAHAGARAYRDPEARRKAFFLAAVLV